jgi:hypothetical protein
MKRLRRALLILLLAVVLICVGWYLMLWAINNARAWRNTSRGVYVTVSKETTVITQPLRKDGYVNYLAALNLRAAEGVTPENNAAVLFWQAMGPNELTPEIRTRFFQMLKMPPPPGHGDYFVSLSNYVKQLDDSRDPRFSKLPGGSRDTVSDQQDEAMQRPWSKEEFPLIADWLAVNEKPLALLLEASKRPRRYDPLLCGDSDEGKLLDASLVHLELSREAGRALLARAMLRLKLGDVGNCWADLLACHRLARLIGQEPGVVDALTAFGIDGRVCQGDQAVLRHARFAAAQAASMREDLDKLLPLPHMADKIDVSERFVFLDSLATMARDGFDTLSNSGGGRPKSGIMPQDEHARASLDWDIMFKNGNSWFDRMVAAGRRANRSQMLAEFDKIEGDLRGLSNSNYDWKTIASSLLFDRRSELIGNTYICLMLPAISATIKGENRGVMRAELVRLGFALAEFRADHGSYPQQLGELSPRYLARVPVDIFAGDATLHYQRQDAGYLLYSVGPNGRDDGGRGPDEGRKAGQDWDDLSVRVPPASEVRQAQ